MWTLLILIWCSIAAGCSAALLLVWCLLPHKARPRRFGPRVVHRVRFLDQDRWDCDPIRRN